MYCINFNNYLALNEFYFRKEDICFRRLKAVQKPQLSQLIQTDLTIGATDLLNVHQLGKSIEITAISETSKRLNAFTKQNDKLIVSTRAKTSIIQEKRKDTTSFHQRNQPESIRSRSRNRSRVRYGSSRERRSRYEPRDYKSRDRARYATRPRSRSRRLSEERRYRHDDRHIDCGQAQTTKRYEEAPSNLNLSRKQDVGKQQKYHENDSSQPVIKDARDVIKLKRARESSCNDRYVLR